MGHLSACTYANGVMRLMVFGSKPRRHKPLCRFLVLHANYTRETQHEVVFTKCVTKSKWR